MDPLGVRNLLLILLLPLSDQNLQTNTTAEPDRSSRFTEFCLHVPGDSHWSSSKPDQSTPTTTALPPSTNRTEPAQTSGGSTQPVNSTNLPGQTEEEDTTQQPEPITAEKITPLFHPRAQHSPKGCRCDGKKKKLPSERSPVRRTQVWPPTGNCRSPEFIERLQDGREVCVTAHSFLTYYNDLVRSQQKKPPTTVKPTTTLPTTTKIKKNVPQCELCTSDLENITPETVRSLFVKMQSLPCKTLIYVNLKDDNGSICVDVDHLGFERLLENLGKLPSFPSNVTLKNTVDKCRCRDTGRRTPPGVPSLIQSAMIWFPNDTCNSTEYIETLIDGKEVCVTPPSLSHYFVPFTDPSGETMLVLPPEIVLGAEGKVISRMETAPLVCPRLLCPPFDWTSIDSKDVESLEMDVFSFECPVYLQVHLKQLDGRPDYFCVSTHDTQFPDVLKKLDIN